MSQRISKRTSPAASVGLDSGKLFGADHLPSRSLSSRMLLATSCNRWSAFRAHFRRAPDRMCRACSCSLPFCCELFDQAPGILPRMSNILRVSLAWGTWPIYSIHCRNIFVFCQPNISVPMSIDWKATPGGVRIQDGMGYVLMLAL